MNVVGQLYQFTRLGFEGYQEINLHMQRTAEQASFTWLEHVGIALGSSSSCSQLLLLLHSDTLSSHCIAAAAAAANCH